MAEYFSHDYNARNDVKLKRLFMKHGVAGIGIYWCIVEMLYEAGGTLPEEAEDVIAYDLRTDPEIVSSVLDDFGLFNRGADNEISSNGVKKRLGLRSEKTEKRKQAAKARWEKLNSADASTGQDDANAMQTQCTCNANALQNDANKTKEKETKVKERKEKERKDYTQDIARVVEAWNQLPPNVAKVQKVAPGSARERHLIARIEELSPDKIIDAIHRAGKSDFLTGKGGTGWTVTFDWFINPTNIQKVIEGNYDNRGKEQTQPASYDIGRAMERMAASVPKLRKRGSQ